MSLTTAMLDIGLYNSLDTIRVLCNYEHYF